MEIQSNLTSRAGQEFTVTYRDIDSPEELGDRMVSAVHAYCFCGDKLVVVYNAEKDVWTPPGGSVEPGETVEEAVVREIHEESNMRVLKHILLGYQDIFEPIRTVTQTRSFCIVEPYGPFISDPDGDITEIKLIDPVDFKQYFDWGIVGDHLMARALELSKLSEIE